MDKEKEKGRARFGVFDAILIVFLVACLIAAGFAVVYRRQSGEETLTEANMQEYIVSFKCYKVAQYHADLLKDGDTVYLPSNKVLGTIKGTPAQTPAEILSEKADGTYVLRYAPSSEKENVDQTLKDVSGTIVVRGKRNSHGILVLEDNYKLAPGQTFMMHTDTSIVSVTIVDIVE